MRRWLYFVFELALLFLVAGPALAEVRLPKLLSDHMVLQRDAPIHIWGWADPGEGVTVRFHSQSISTKTSQLGLWSIYLAPEPAGGPFQLSVQGTNTITLSDILIGDVWLASGQSNMEIPLDGFPGHGSIKNAAEEIAHANHPQIRLLTIPRRSSAYPLNDADAQWVICTPETARKFSAVAYFFGHEIQEREHVPIGLIDATWGGTIVGAWLSLDALTADSSLMPVFAASAQMTDEQSNRPLVIAREQREDLAAKASGQLPPRHPGYPDPSSWAPGALFNGMIAPETADSIKGVIWYQGEANARIALTPLYQKVFITLIGDWRTKWHEGNFPFLFVQISSFESDSTRDWGLIREAQRRALSVANTAMAVSLDVGARDNVHPPDKETVAHRLALAARVLGYHESIEYSGPIFHRAVPEGTAMRVWFDHDEDLHSTSQNLKGFEIAGADHRFFPARAHLEDGSVLVSSPQISKPKFVRYGWANYAVTSLVNGAGLPASTFTSEDDLFVTPPLRAHF